MREKRSTQRIEEIAANLLDENKLKTFLDFYAFLSSNKIGKAKTGRKINGSWAIQYKNKKIGHFHIGENLWSIDYFDLFSRNKWFEKCEKYLTTEMKDFVLTNINTVSSCCVKGICHSVEYKIIFGKMINSRMCACRPINLDNPDSKTLEYAKELVLIGKNITAEMAESSIK